MFKIIVFIANLMSCRFQGGTGSGCQIKDACSEVNYYHITLLSALSNVRHGVCRVTVRCYTLFVERGKSQRPGFNPPAGAQEDGQAVIYWVCWG